VVVPVELPVSITPAVPYLFCFPQKDSCKVLRLLMCSIMPQNVFSDTPVHLDVYLWGFRKSQLRRMKELRR
jgi:hypothetical protein